MFACEVGLLMIILLQISWKMWQWKNFENRPVFDSVPLCISFRYIFYFYDRSGTDYWFALYKRTATPDGTTYWLDGNPSTYRWWIADDPNEDVLCILYTRYGFRDRSCTSKFQYTCKMAAGKNLLLLGSWGLHVYDYFNNGQPQDSSFCWDFCIIETIRFLCIITMSGLNQKNALTLLIVNIISSCSYAFLCRSNSDSEYDNNKQCWCRRSNTNWR